MSQELKNGGNTSLGFATGTVCPKSGLYKATDGKIEIIEYIPQDTLFPPFGGGNGTKKATWSRVTLATDGSRTGSGFRAVMVDAGTL